MTQTYFVYVRAPTNIYRYMHSSETRPKCKTDLYFYELEVFPNEEKIFSVKRKMSTPSFLNGRMVLRSKLV